LGEAAMPPAPISGPKIRTQVDRSIENAFRLSSLLDPAKKQPGFLLFLSAPDSRFLRQPRYAPGNFAIQKEIRAEGNDAQKAGRRAGEVGVSASERSPPVEATREPLKGAGRSLPVPEAG